MRFLTIAAATALLMLPATGRATASGPAELTAKAVSTDYSAKKHKKHHKKPKMKKEKVEYMRAAPMK
jgi:hypothetical protein